MEDVNVMDIDGDIVDGGCNGEVLSDGFIGEERVGGEADKGDGVMNEGDKSSTSRVTRTIVTDCGVVRVRVCWFFFLVDLSLGSVIHAMRMFFDWRREDNSRIQCRIPLQLI